MRLALVGGRGMLARKVKERLPPHYELTELNRPAFDVTERAVVLEALRALRPRVIVNCAAFTWVDACETESAAADAVNGAGPGYLAEASREIGAVLVHVSSDYVFDGSLNRPWREDDPTRPLSAYGRSKLKGEQAIVASGLETYFILRTGWLYGPGGGNFVETICRLAAEREELRIVADQTGTPTYAGDLAEALFALLETEAYGLYHVANSGACTWYVFACAIVDQLRERGELCRVASVTPITTAEYPLPARRPAYSVLDKSKLTAVSGLILPHWDDALRRYMAERQGSRV